MLSLIARYPLTFAACIVCVVAWIRGGRPELWGASAIAVTWTLVIVGEIITGEAIPVMFDIGADLLLAGAFLWIALRYGSAWLGAAMMMQGMSFAVHAAYLCADVADRRSYSVALNAASGLMLLSILGGTVASWRRRGRRSRQPIAAHS